MLKKFTVENFRGFKDKITLDLGSASNYGFHEEVVHNGCITKAIVYGINGCGKSNLGLALFDIVCHLTDKNQLPKDSASFLNFEGSRSYAEFFYSFVFDEAEVIYRYRKDGNEQLMEESLSIMGREVIYYDFSQNSGFTSLQGTENLNQSITGESPMSRVKYVNSNSILADSRENEIFSRFIDFVNKMLLFFSLDNRGYQGFRTGSEGIAEGIIESGRLQDFQQFLCENNIHYELQEASVDGRRTITCHYNRENINFFTIASTGTKSLALFYYWYIRMQEASFVYIDEFDAFYHFELSANIIRRLRDIENVQIMTTTHNTDLMSNELLRPDCYFILKNNILAAVADTTEKELRKAHNLQKMYKAGAFDG